VQPKVSIIIPVHNGERTIGRAIDSALGQRFGPEFEVIVIDDGSTDGTAEVLRRFGDRIIAIRGEHKGVSAARNAGARIARGDYLAFLDADDEWTPEKLGRTVPLLEEAPECVLAYHDAAEVDGAGRIQRGSCYPQRYSPPSFEEMLTPRGHVNPLLTCTIVIRRSVFDRCGGFNEEMAACEDTYTWIRAREYGPFAFVPEVLARREFGLSAPREEWYIAGAGALNRAMRERYGSRFRGDFQFEILRWSAWSAYRRGDRRTAIRRYLAALRLDPFAPKTYAFLAVALFPRKLVSAVASLIHGAAHREIVPASTVQEQRSIQ